MIRGWENAKAVLIAVLLCACALIASPGVGHADASLAVDDKTDWLDLATARNPIVAQRPEISVQGPGETMAATLRAKGPGPVYNWSLFSFRNTTDHELNLIIAFEPQRFGGSGLWQIQPAGANVISATIPKDGRALALGEANGVRNVNVHIASKDVVNVAVESLSPKLNATLWQAGSYEVAQAQASYFKGLVEGIVVLLTFGILAINAFRPNRAALAGWLFALASCFFIAADNGLLSGYLLSGNSWAPAVQAGTLSFMAAALALCVMAFLFTIPRQPVLAAILAAACAAALANIAYGLAEPIRAGVVARFGLAAMVATGFITTWMQRKRPGEMIDRRLLFWSALLCWTVIAGIVAIDANFSDKLSSELAAGLAAVLLCLVIVLLHHVTRSGLAARPFITDASLRSLALTAGRHAMWDWQPQKGELHIGSELLKSLDLNSADWPQAGQQKFHELLHPLDLESYQRLAEREEFRPGERVHMEMRLRDAMGAYRWFELQAATVPGPDNQVERCIGTLTDISNLKKVEERLTSDAVQDMVTNLPNKGLFVDRLERSLSKLNALPLRVIIVDLDRFKALNEGLGQETGDRILKVSAERLTDLVEPDETVARLAGSQFALLCIETIDRGDFSNFLQSLHAAIAAPIKHGFQHVVLAASVGVSASSAEGGKAQDLIDQAHVAMLEARAEGGARSSIFHVEMKDERAKLMSLESDLRVALERHEIEIYYQPIVYLHSLAVLGFEALARWRHPELGLLTPAEFLDIAETAGMMNEIGYFMLSGAARQLGIWQRVHMRGRPFFVSVNVSASQLANGELLRQISSILDRENLVPGSLKIEVTETMIMRQPERSAKLMQQLQGMGVGLACDDFGTGFSSLASLRDFPFDTLKIDRSFLTEDGLDERNAKIVSSITALARSLNMAVVAEGLETQAQIDKLAELGCGLGQGYLIGIPEPAEQAATRLLRMNAATAASRSLAALPHTTPPFFSSHPIAQPERPRSPFDFTTPPMVLPLKPLKPLSIQPFTHEKAEELPSIFTLTEAKPEPQVPKPKAKPKKSPARKKK